VIICFGIWKNILIMCFGLYTPCGFHAGKMLNNSLNLDRLCLLALQSRPVKLSVGNRKRDQNQHENNNSPTFRRVGINLITCHNGGVLALLLQVIPFNYPPIEAFQRLLKTIQLVCFYRILRFSSGGATLYVFKDGAIVGVSHRGSYFCHETTPVSIPITSNGVVSSRRLQLQ
jgi:hypothetical protein